MSYTTQIERAMLAGAKRARQNYAYLTGAWLLHAPESFLQYEVARAIKRRAYAVYTEASPERIAKEAGKALRGRPRKPRSPTSTRRPHPLRSDVTVWSKSAHKTNATVEIKRTTHSSFNQIRGDAKKIKTYINRRTTDGAGYLLIYSEIATARGRRTRAERAEALSNRFKSWLDELRRHSSGWKLRGRIQIGSENVPPGDDRAAWSWGIALFRYDRVRFRSRLLRRRRG